MVSDAERTVVRPARSLRKCIATVALSGTAGSQIDDALVMQLRFAAGTVGTVHIAWTRAGQPGIYATDVLADDDCQIRAVEDCRMVFESARKPGPAWW